jgi:hypothetical protein
MPWLEGACRHLIADRLDIGYDDASRELVVAFH